MATVRVARLERLIREAGPLRFSDPERALELALQAYRLAQRLRYTLGIADALSLIALCDFARSNYREAFTAMEDSIPLYHEAGAGERAAVMRYNLGYFHATLGDYPSAIESYLQSIGCSEAHSYSRRAALAELGRAFAMIGDVQRGLAFATEALHDSAVPLNEQIHDLIHHGMGEIRLIRGEPEEALRHFEQALEIAGSRENLRRAGMALNGIGQIHLSQSEPRAAASMFGRALELHRSIDYRPGIGELHLHLGELEIARNNPAAAIAHLMHSLNVGREMQSVPLLVSAHTAMSGALRRQGDLTRALEHLETAHVLAKEALPLAGFWRISRALAAFDRWQSEEGSVFPIHEIVNERTSDSESTDSTFTRRLLQRHGDLTPSEIRICGLLRLNHSTKEIAQLLHVTPHNVDMHRWRIRRKLRLPAGSHLSAYLGSI